LSACAVARRNGFSPTTLIVSATLGAEDDRTAGAAEEVDLGL
jgi:hypothetical protein